MAFNQASFFLFAPGFGPTVEFDHSTKTVSGKPLAIISSDPIDPTAAKVLTESLRQWFVERGFLERERYGGCQVLYRGQQRTFLGTQEEIELTLPLDEDVIQELYIRFLLTEQTPQQLADWRELIVELGDDFGFQLMDESHSLLPCIDFPVVLAANWHFCTFQQNYGWEI